MTESSAEQGQTSESKSADNRSIDSPLNEVPLRGRRNFLWFLCVLLAGLGLLHFVLQNVVFINAAEYRERLILDSYMLSRRIAREQGFAVTKSEAILTSQLGPLPVGQEFRSIPLTEMPIVKDVAVRDRVKIENSRQFLSWPTVWNQTTYRYKVTKSENEDLVVECRPPVVQLGSVALPQLRFVFRKPMKSQDSSVANSDAMLHFQMYQRESGTRKWRFVVTDMGSLSLPVNLGTGSGSLKKAPERLGIMVFVLQLNFIQLTQVMPFLERNSKPGQRQEEIGLKRLFAAGLELPAELKHYRASLRELESGRLELNLQPNSTGSQRTYRIVMVSPNQWRVED